MKVMFYSHNVYGLGHVIRSARIARAASELGMRCTLVTGCPALGDVDLDPRVEVERLPAVRVEGGRFHARDSANQSQDIIATRAAMLLRSMREREPDAVVVDHLPLGLGGELRPSLLAAADENWPTRFVWGMPYSEGASTQHAPGNPKIRRAYARYDCVLAYGSPDYDDVFAQLPAWILPPVRRYVGFVPGPVPHITKPARPRIVGLVGGGFEAPKLFEALLTGFRALRREWGSASLRLVVGPLGELARVRELVGDDPDVEIWSTGAIETAIADASIVVSRVGYNSAFTLARCPLPLILVPQGMAADDQPRRAAQLSRLPGIEVLDEYAPDFIDRITSSLAAGLASGPVARELLFPVDGARQAALAIASLINDSRNRSDS
jgi:predicted glycosyltransferase